MQLNAGGIYFMAFVIKKKLKKEKKNSRKQPLYLKIHTKAKETQEILGENSVCLC